MGPRVSVAPRRRLARWWGTSVTLRLHVAAFALGCLATLVLSVLQFYRVSPSGPELGRTALRIVAIHGAGALSSALSVACVAEWFVLRHLRAIGHALGREPMCEAPPALILKRRRAGPPDELDGMVLTFNALSTRLYCAHRRCEELEARTDALSAELARAKQNLSTHIDEREGSEANLRMSEARLRVLAEASPVPVSISTLSGERALYVNEPMRELFRISEDEAASIRPTELYVDTQVRSKIVDRLRRYGKIRAKEVKFRRPDGTTFWAMFTARLATCSDDHAMYVGLSDVSERKEAEDRLRANQASLANAQRLAGVGDWRWDAEKGVMHWSEELAEIVGFAPKDSHHNYARYLAQVHPDDRAPVRRALCMVLVGHDAQAVDHRIVGPDGTVRIVQLKVEVAADASGSKDGRPVGLVGTIQDVTERKRIERELLESREKLREFGAYMEATREDERKRIALEIHDELGQLLTALKMDVALLKMRLTAPDLLQKVVEMRELVDKTIWMVRNVANHLRPAALNFGLVSALEWLAEDFGRRNQIPCRFRLHGGEPVLPEAHATAVFRVVQESLTNVARHAHATHVHVTLTRSERGFELSVSDNGCGFDPVAASRAASYGLLSMSERARLIGASLRIDSAPGLDTVVSISVPLECGVHEAATELSR